MNEDRPATNPNSPKPPRAASPPIFDFTVEVEFRGETLWYIQPARKVSMMWFWTRGYEIHYDTIQTWQNTDGGSTPVTELEREKIVSDLKKYAREVQNTELNVVR